jgi:hypothetical protein
MISTASAKELTVKSGVSVAHQGELSLVEKLRTGYHERERKEGSRFAKNQIKPQAISIP